MITLGLDPKLEQAVNITAKNLGLTKSELIRQCITDYIAKSQYSNAWEVGKDLFGKHSSNQGNLSVDRKELLKSAVSKILISGESKIYQWILRIHALFFLQNNSA